MLLFCKYLLEFYNWCILFFWASLIFTANLFIKILNFFSNVLSFCFIFQLSLLLICQSRYRDWLWRKGRWILKKMIDTSEIINDPSTRCYAIFSIVSIVALSIHSIFFDSSYIFFKYFCMFSRLIFSSISFSFAFRCY